MSSKQGKPRLSKGILEMKFMQRTKEKVSKENEEAEGRAMYSNEITNRMIHNNSNFITEASFIFCEDLKDGRFSCRGMNPDLERLLEQENAESNAAKKDVQKKDVSDQDMVQFYQSQIAPAAIKAIQKKFQTKNQFKRKSNDYTKGRTTTAQKVQYKITKKAEV